MTDLETTLRRGLTALADDVRLPVPELARRRWRARPVVVGAVVGSVLLGGAAAAATGLVPVPVERVFDEITGWNPAAGVDPDTARLVATTTFEGTTYEYWATPGDARCEYMRMVRAGHVDNGWKSCTDSTDATESVFGDADFYATGSSGIPEGTSHTAGHAPAGTATVVLTFDDGAVRRVPVQEDGYFVVAYRTDAAGWRTLVALDADGNELARRGWTP